MEETAVSGNTVPSSNSVPTQTPETDQQCCICMRKDRKLLHLCLVNGGDNSLFSLLCDDEDDTPDGEKEPTRLIICWECDAIMSKVVRFRQQASKAQRRLSSIVEGRNMAQNTFLLIPPIAGARPAGLEPQAVLEYRTVEQADSQSLLRVVRYGHYLYLYRFGNNSESVLPDGTSGPLPLPLPLPNADGSHSALLELLGGLNH